MRAAILALLALAGAARGQPVPLVKSLGPEPPRNVLYVGNSFFYFNQGLQNVVRELLRAAVPGGEFEARLEAIGGASLSRHDVESYLQPGAPEAVPGKGKHALVESEPSFDAVILADCSQCPIHPKLKGDFRVFARKDAEIAVRHGARPVLFMTWAYRDRPEMTRQLADAYTEIANENQALVIPAGLAFSAARDRDPSIDLYNPDGRHPSPAGTYLAACTVLAAVYETSPVGNPHHGGLDAKTAATLQAVAEETVKKYLGR